ncbi:MAG: cyclopropane-fatty-acyl-phospholipid synthase family protein [Acidobacteriota bacterium]
MSSRRNHADLEPVAADITGPNAMAFDRGRSTLRRDRTHSRREQQTARQSKDAPAKQEAVNTPEHGLSGLYRRAVFSALEPMSHGRLVIETPDGQVHRFGESTNPRGSLHGLEASIRVLRHDFFRRCFYYGDIGLAEGYLAGDWDTDDLAEVVSWFILNAESSPSQSASRRRQKVLNALGWINNLTHRMRANTVAGSRVNIASHYDLSNDFFALFLDPSMTYSSALFDTASASPGTGATSPRESLELAQYAKYERLARLLELRAGDRVLEIGGGWGAFSRFAAKRYGCHVTSITISQAQFSWADRLRREEQLEEAIDLQLVDYRKLTGQFDKIVSIEMLEAVGHEYFDTFFAQCSSLLKPNGLVALQVITCPDTRYEALRRGVDFIQKHIFPGGLIPSVGALVASIGRATDFTVPDLFDFGDSYARTLQMWDDEFEAKLDAVRALGFDEIFIRKWRYYLLYCKAAFQMRHVSVVQMLLSRPNNHDLAPARPVA